MQFQWSKEDARAFMESEGQALFDDDEVKHMTKLLNRFEAARAAKLQDAIKQSKQDEIFIVSEQFVRGPKNMVFECPTRDKARMTAENLNDLFSMLQAIKASPSTSPDEDQPTKNSGPKI
jgi:5-methylcytosine-specific restriction endonuclease McrBC regulatory subunit McrC